MKRRLLLIVWALFWLGLAKLSFGQAYTPPFVVTIVKGGVTYTAEMPWSPTHSHWRAKFAPSHGDSWIWSVGGGNYDCYLYATHPSTIDGVWRISSADLADGTATGVYQWGAPAGAPASTVTVTIPVGVEGERYASDVMYFQICWTTVSTFFKAAGGQNVMPGPNAVAVVPVTLGNARNLSVPSGSLPGAGWHEDDLARALQWNFPAGVTTGTRYNVTQPLRYTSVLMYASNYGGYAVAGVDMREAEYDEYVYRYYSYSVQPGTSNIIENIINSSVVGVRGKAGGVVERWLFIFSTERDTRKPYVEIRKPNGSRMRLYARGNTPHNFINGYATFNVQSDGSTLVEGLGEIAGVLLPATTVQALTWPGLGLEGADVTEDSEFDAITVKQPTSQPTSVLATPSISNVRGKIPWVWNYTLPSFLNPSGTQFRIETQLDAAPYLASNIKPKIDTAIRAFALLCGFGIVMQEFKRR